MPGIEPPGSKQGLCRLLDMSNAPNAIPPGAGRSAEQPKLSQDEREHAELELETNLKRKKPGPPPPSQEPAS